MTSQLEAEPAAVYPRRIRSSIDRLAAKLGGRYAIPRELGEGGMATVYLADDLKHERKVAHLARMPVDYE